MPPRVSVILAPPTVPDRGSISSLDRQSLPVHDFEVVVALPGSHAPATERLHRLAENRPNVRVIETGAEATVGERLGVGAAGASGDYVLFLPDGTRLDERALERLCAHADETAADICLGRTSRARSIATGPATPLLADRDEVAKDAALLGRLDAGRLYRREFLDTLPDPGDVGPDEPAGVAFNLVAISRTDKIFALETCAAFLMPGPLTIGEAAAQLRAVRDTDVDEDLRRGALSALHARNLGLVAELAMTGLSAHDLAELDTYTQVLKGPQLEDLDDDLSPLQRTVAAAVRSGELGNLSTMVRHMRTPLRVDDVQAVWSEGVLHLELDLQVGDSQHGPLHPGNEPAIGLGLLRPEDGVEWPVPQEHVTVSGEGASRHVSAQVRLGSVAGGEPLPNGTWIPALRLVDNGMVRRPRLPVAKDGLGASHATGLTVVAFRRRGKLALDVGATEHGVVGRVDPALVSLAEDVRGTLLRVGLPRVDLEPGAELQGQLRIGGLPVPAAIRSHDEQACLEAFVSGLTGSYPLATLFTTKTKIAPSDYAPMGLRLEIDAVGRMTTRQVRRDPRAESRTPALDGDVRSRLRRTLRRIPGTATVYRRVRTNALLRRRPDRGRQRAGDGAAR